MGNAYTQKSSQQSGKSIYIGVDGGASKCRVRIEDANGNILGIATGGPAVFKFSAEKTWKTILETITAALQAPAIDLTDKQFDFHLGLGLTGCEIPKAKQAFLDIAPPYFKQIHLESDAYTACLGAHNGEDGSIIIIGTGVVSMQIQNNKITQVGGWGFPHSDEGSGAWLGLEATRLTFHWLDGRVSEPSPLLKKIFAKFDNNLPFFVTWANQANSSEFATIAPLVIEQIENKDPFALHLIQRAAAEIDRIGTVLESKAENNIVPPCVLCGGLAPFVEVWLSDKLKKRLTPCKNDAAYGAILMAKLAKCNLPL